MIRQPLMLDDVEAQEVDLARLQQRGRSQVAHDQQHDLVVEDEDHLVSRVTYDHLGGALAEPGTAGPVNVLAVDADLGGCDEGVKVLAFDRDLAEERLDLAGVRVRGGAVGVLVGHNLAVHDEAA